MLLWKPENTDPAPSPRPVRPAPLRIASRHRARARAPRARLCSAQPRCDLRSRRFSVAPRPRPGLPSVAPEMHAAAGLPRGLADRFCRAPERVSSGPTCRGRGSSPGSPVTWSQPAPAPTPWGQSRGARPAPPPPGASASSVSRGISSTKGMDPCNLPLSFWNVPGGGHSYPLSIIPTVCGALNTVWGNPWPPVCLLLFSLTPSLEPSVMYVCTCVYVYIFSNCAFDPPLAIAYCREKESRLNHSPSCSRPPSM